MGERDLAGEGESDSRPSGLGREEGHEDFVEQLLLDTRPVVGDLDDERVRIMDKAGLCPDLRATLPSCLERESPW